MPGIPFVVENLEEVVESLRPHYVEQDDGRFRFGIEGAVEKSRLDEFRGTNTNLNKEKAELERQLSVYRTLGDDAEKLREEVDSLRKLQQRVADKDLIDKSGFEKAVEQRTQEMKSASDGQIRALSEALKKETDRADAAVAENKRILIQREITEAVIASGAESRAIPDILDRAKRDGWTLNEHNEAVMFKNGEIVFGENGVDPLTPKEWAARHLRDSAPWFFERSTGAGSVGSSSPGSPKNPWTRENWNKTEQAKFALKEGMAKAEAMARAAGSTVTAAHPPA